MLVIMRMAVTVENNSFNYNDLQTVSFEITIFF